jgi:SNF2 family DNA or RNA helicase
MTPQVKQIPLWEHQKQAVPYLANMDEFALFFEMGTGKTATMIHGLRTMFTRAGRVQRTIILAPLIVLRNWKKEFAMHSNIKPDNILVLDQAGKKRLELFQKQRARQENFIVITNYEAMQMTSLLIALLQWNPEILICDESHRLKNHQSKRAKVVLDLARRTKRRYLLSGTPVLNSALDIFMQYQILEGGRSEHMGATFGNNFYVFRAQYFYDANAAFKHKHTYFPDYQPKPSAHKEVNSKIYRKAMRVVKADCLDLPPLVRQTIEVELSPEQRKLYAAMKKDYVAFLNEQSDKPKAVVAQLAITKALRLQQICSGYVKTDAGEEIPLENTPRLSALNELLEDLTPVHKVIVWCVFKNNYRQVEKVCAALGLSYRSITGEVSNKDKSQQVEDFQNDPGVRVMIANQGAGGVGINLTAASYSIFFSRNFSLEADLQAEARNYRGGSEVHEKVTRIDLVAPDTIDALVLDALARKQKISDEILEWKL